MCDNGTKKDNLKTLNQNVSNSCLWLVWSNIRPKANYNYWLYQCVVITPRKKKKKKMGVRTLPLSVILLSVKDFQSFANECIDELPLKFTRTLRRSFRFSTLLQQERELELVLWL